MKVIEEGYLIHEKDTDEYMYPNFGIYTRKKNAEYQCDLYNRRYCSNNQCEVVPVQIVEVETNESTGRSMQSTQ